MFKEFFEYSSTHNGISFASLNKMVPNEELEGAPVTYAVVTIKARGLSHIQESEVNPATEWKFWIPTEAHEIAKGFQKRHCPGVREESFAELLHKLNHIWHKREKLAVSQLKTKHIQELQDLRKEMADQ